MLKMMTMNESSQVSVTDPDSSHIFYPSSVIRSQTKSLQNWYASIFQGKLWQQRPWTVRHQALTCSTGIFLHFSAQWYCTSYGKRGRMKKTKEKSFICTEKYCISFSIITKGVSFSSLTCATVPLKPDPLLQAKGNRGFRFASPANKTM